MKYVATIIIILIMSLLLEIVYKKYITNENFFNFRRRSPRRKSSDIGIDRRFGYILKPNNNDKINNKKIIEILIGEYNP